MASCYVDLVKVLRIINIRTQHELSEIQDLGYLSKLYSSTREDFENRLKPNRKR